MYVFEGLLQGSNPLNTCLEKKNCAYFFIIYKWMEKGQWKMMVDKVHPSWISNECFWEWISSMYNKLRLKELMIHL
jgi:hypothetical protein